MLCGTSGIGGEPREKIDLALIENVQNKLTLALVKQAKDLQLKAADWLQGGWSRGKGASIIERRLIKINNQIIFQNKYDYLKILPENLNVPFTNKEFAKSAKIPVRAARQITYCLRKSGVIYVAEKKGRALYFKKV